MKTFTANPLVRRLVACLFGGFVLALMVGNQEGSQNDFGISFREATTTVRLIAFLLVGVAVFLVITFWPAIAPYVRHPGAAPVVVGFIVVLSGMALLHWYDPVGKFNAVSTAVSHTSHPPFLAGLFFSWFAWVLMAAAFVLGGAAVATRKAALGYAELVLGVVAAVVTFVAHHQLVSFDGRIDHSLGMYVAIIGYLIFAVAGGVTARASAEVADPIAAIERTLAWRPGLPVALIGAVLGLNAVVNASWFAGQQLNAGFAKTRTDFRGEGLPFYASSYLSWLAITLLAVATVVAVIAAYYRIEVLGYVTAVLGLAGVILTFMTLREITKISARVVPQYGATWQNLGSAGWVECLGFTLIAAAGALTVTGVWSLRAEITAAKVASAGGAKIAIKRSARGSAIGRAIIPAAIAVCLFYPPTLPLNWQNVIVAQISVYLLLAVGLNVVVGWAGLLDLGYIAFYGIGSYTTAYFTSSLPLKPPSWLHFTPLEAIPFAIIGCLIAGVLLGAPTLRLRGDYLAIVTLGFGEIIQIVAINNPGNLTGGPIGPTVPHPRLHIWKLNVTWGIDNLPYWYLLIALLGIVLILFYRLEGSRLGRAWAAIREDEVAAQATGVQTTKIKLLAFSIGASTSGLAGVFFASQVGYFDPSEFTLQNSILIVAYVVFGGMGSLPGALAGAAVLTWLPYFLQSQVPLPDANMWIGALVMVMMIFRPAGLIPARRRAAELSGLRGPTSADVMAVPVAEGL